MALVLNIIDRDQSETVKEIHFQVLQEVPKRVEIAFDKWLAGDSNGKKSGRPRFKAIGQYKTFTYPQFKQHHFSGNKITLSKIGDVKVIVHRQIPEGFEIKTVSITQKSNGYYVTLSLDDKTVSTIKRDFNPDNRVEGENTRLRHYLARLKRKTLCYSKCEKMLGYSIKLLIHYLKFGDVPIPHQNPRNHFRLPSRIFARIIP